MAEDRRRGPHRRGGAGEIRDAGRGHEGDVRIRRVQGARGCWRVESIHTPPFCKAGYEHEDDVNRADIFTASQVCLDSISVTVSDPRHAYLASVGALGVEAARAVRGKVRSRVMQSPYRPASYASSPEPGSSVTERQGLFERHFNLQALFDIGPCRIPASYIQRAMPIDRHQP